MPNDKVELVKGGRKVNGVFEPTPVAPKPTVITPASLESTSVINVPEPPTATGQTMMLSEMDVADDFTQAQTLAKQNAQAGKNTALDTYLSNLMSSPGKAELENEEYGIHGVDAANADVKFYQDELRKEKHALLRATQRVTERGGGLSSGANAEISNLERLSFAKQADISILEQGAQGRYDSAKATADRAVDAKFERNEKITTALKDMYLDAKETFDTAEQREFETLLANREAKIAEEKQKQKDIYDLAINAQKDGAPTSVVQQMMKSGTREEAMAAGGSYIGALDRQAKLASINASNLSARKSIMELAQAGDPQAISQLGFDPSTLDAQDSQLLAYAQQYATDGKIPTGLKDAGVSFGQIASVAKTLPQPEGAIVSAQTGVKDANIPVAEQGDLSRLYNIVRLTKELETLDQGRGDGLVAGTLNQAFGNNQTNAYLTKRKAIVDEIARMQTGAALTGEEQTFYKDYLPGATSNPLGLGTDSTERIKQFNSIMETKLQNALATNGLVIHGYSTLNLGEQQVHVGDIVENGTGRYRVNADGSLTQLDI